ncbi:MAG: hypothetical protein EPN84_00265 [Legionella sp.]|nr:MAG: hypothetical protein EPN84_00265 [Legionella sp.]
MKMKLSIILLGILCSFHAIADGYLPEPAPLDQPWSVSGSVGGGKYPHPSNSSPLGRLALGNDLFLTGDYLLGLELGVQSSPKVTLDIPVETLTVLQWLPIQASLGPMLDLLITAKSDPLAGSNFFAQLKGGVAYRYWQAHKEPINDYSQITGEIQAGLGYPITTLATLNLLYQGVFGNDPNPLINSETKTIHVSNIPTLHAVLFGFTINL